MPQGLSDDRNFRPLQNDNNTIWRQYTQLQTNKGHNAANMNLMKNEHCIENWARKYKKVWNYPFTFMGMSLIYGREITLSLTNLAYPNYN